MSGGTRIRAWSCMDYVIFPIMLVFVAAALDMLQAGSQAWGMVGMLNPLPWILLVIAVMQFLWLFARVPVLLPWKVWEEGRKTGDELTLIAKAAAMKAAGRYDGPDEALPNGYDLPVATVASYTRTLKQKAFGHLAVQVTAGVDRYGHVLGISYHLEDVCFTAADMGWNEVDHE